jgi:hypothetical protein
MASITRTDNLSQLGEWFDLLERKIARDGFLGHHDLNIEIEYVFRDLLNFAYGWDLENANNVFGKNQEAFDLSSGSGTVCVQVTTTQGAAKIVKTLSKFIPGYRNRFNRLVFIYPVMTMKKSQKSFKDEADGFDFQPGRDRLCFRDLLEQAQQMTAVRQSEFLDLVQSELGPLGAALRLGTEPSVDLLIAVIAHMANYGTPEQMSHHESRPDDERKLARFQDHAGFLKRQFNQNREFYIPVQQARKAVGIDAANTPRIHLWLRSNSLDLLEEHSDNAKDAFTALADRLLRETHRSGRNADVTAVRFLLADEFFRCNVFPNPDED